MLKRLIVAAALALAASLAGAQSNANLCFPIFPEAAHSEAQANSPLQTNATWTGITITPNVSSRTSGTYTVAVQAQVAASPTVYYTILTSGNISATGVATPMVIYPGITAASNVAVSTPLPAKWRIQLTGTSTPLMVLSVSGCLAN